MMGCARAVPAVDDTGRELNIVADVVQRVGTRSVTPTVYVDRVAMARPPGARVRVHARAC